MADYECEDGRIRSPGKFEGEALYVPYFWDMYMDGFAQSVDDGVIKMAVELDDRIEFPELEGIEEVWLWVTEQGFVTEIQVNPGPSVYQCPICGSDCGKSDHRLGISGKIHAIWECDECNISWYLPEKGA